MAIVIHSVVSNKTTVGHLPRIQPIFLTHREELEREVTVEGDDALPLFKADLKIPCYARNWQYE